MSSECQMRPAIVKWLADMGHLPVFEVHVNRYHPCDIAGVKFDERLGRSIPELKSLIAIELKLFRVADVIQQASRNAACATCSYAAMPKSTCDLFTLKTVRRFEEAGIGLLSVDVDGGFVFEEVVEPQVNREPICDRLRKNLWRRRNEPVRGPKKFVREVTP